MASGPLGGLKAEINVTPLVDVVLVLLIIFMVITPMLTRGRDVQLPVASSADSEHEARDALVLTITADGRIWVETQAVARGDLESAIKRRLAERSHRDVLIKADAKVSVRELRPVLQYLKTINVTDVAFAVLGRHGASP
jgi:biopolymer transport protein TolR